MIQVVIGQNFLILAHRMGCKTRKFVMIFTPIHIPEYGSGALPEGSRMKPLSITPSRVTSEYHKFATRSFSIPELWVVVENVLLVLLAENAMHLLELIWWCKGISIQIPVTKIPNFPHTNDSSDYPPRAIQIKMLERHNETPDFLKIGSNDSV